MHGKKRVHERAKGGVGRAKALAPNRRAEIAKKAAQARWDPAIPEATFGSPDRPLRIGNISLECYVLDNEERVFSQRGMMTALGLKVRGRELERFSEQLSLSKYLSPEAWQMLKHPAQFRRPGGGPLVSQYPAELLIDICNAVLDSAQAAPLPKHYEFAKPYAEMMIRAVAKTGIIALIDEATGYQKERAADSLARILEAFIAKELQPWVSTFPSEFYEELFRLRGLEFPNGKVTKPWYFGHLTNDIVYRRLAPGILAELKRVQVKGESGRPKHKLFQKLTQNLGYPKLREHLGAVVAYMKMSRSYEDFKDKLERHLPPFDKPIPLPFPDEVSDDTGTGL